MITGSWTCCRVSTIDELLKAKQEQPEAKIVCGNTELGIEAKHKGHPKTMLYAPNVAELRCVRIHDDAIELGVGLSLSEVKSILNGIVLSRPAHLVCRR